jgi:hypothetical protein
MCFFNLAEQGYLQQTEPISTLNMLAENTPWETTSVCTGKQCSKSSCLSHKWLSFAKCMCFFNSVE